MTANDKVISLSQFEASLSSLTSIDDGLPNLQTLPSLHRTISNTLDQPTAKNVAITSTVSGSDVSEPPATFLRVKKSLSSIPSLTCLEDVYDRIEKFLDDEGLFITSISPDRHLKKQLSLKPCLNLQKYASNSDKSKADSEDLARDNLSDGDLGGVAVPSFLAKRVQRSMSGVFSLPSGDHKLSPFSPFSLKTDSSKANKSNFSKFHFSEAANQEDGEKVV